MAKRHYLNIFIKNNKPDVLLLAEHKLSAKHNFYINGYKIFRCDRVEGMGGGTAVLVKEKHKCERFYLNCGNIEACAARIWKSDGTPITFVSLYQRPGESFQVNDLNAIVDLGNTSEIVVGADLNAKHPLWGGNETNDRGRKLENFITLCPNLMACSTYRPTRPNGTGGSHIDFFLHSPGIIPEGGNQLATLDFESDHRAVRLIININDVQRGIVQKFYDYDHMNIHRFRRRLHVELAHHMLPTNNNVTINNIDDCVAELESVFRNAIQEAVPKRSRKKGTLGELPSRILHFIKERKRLNRALKRSHDPDRILILKADIRNLSRIIEGMIYEFEGNRRKSMLQNIEVNSKTYSKVKMAVGISGKNSVGDLVSNDGSIVCEDLAKAEIIANNIESNYQTSDFPNDSSFNNLINEAIDGISSGSPLVHFNMNNLADGSVFVNRTQWYEIGFVKPGDIQWAISRRPSKKACGIDDIPDIALKRAGDVVFKFLAVLINHCLNLSYFPRAWKVALMVPIPKPGGNPENCSDYRPISLLSPFGKILEMVIQQRIKRDIEDRNILRNCQFGFKPGHCTTHALACFTDYVSKGLNKKNGTLAVSLDFSKAFDRVWQQGIIYKLQSFGFSEHICSMVKSFLDGRHFMVKVGEKRSSQRQVLAGVPQGSILGPLLYNIYVSDIPGPPQGGLLLMYADDVLIAFRGPLAKAVNRKMNTYLQELSVYFDRWKLQLNVAKCQSIVLTGTKGLVYKNFRHFVPNVRIGDGVIQTYDTLKYLGILFHDRFDFCRHVDFVLKKAKKVYFTYNKVLSMSGGLPIKVKLLIYTQVIRPIISYAFPSWFGISSHQMERIRIWERAILRACLGLRSFILSDGSFRRPSNKEVYERSGLQRIDRFLVKSGLKFVEKSQNINNEMIRSSLISNDDPPILEKRHLSPADLTKLRDEGILYDNNSNLLFYHRRYKTFNITDTVYITSQ